MTDEPIIPVQTFKGLGQQTARWDTSKLEAEGMPTDPPRPVWMTKAEDVRLLQRVAAAAKAGTKIESMDANALIVLADRWFSAPADSVTVAQTIIEHGIDHRERPETCRTPRSRSEWAAGCATGSPVRR